MSAYTVKTADGDRLVDGVEGLRELVLSGVVTEETQVRRGQRGKWRPANEVRGLATAFSEVAEAGTRDAIEDDPWAAWGEDIDDDEDVIDEVTGHSAFVPPDIDIEDDDETQDSELDNLDSLDVSVGDIVVEAPSIGAGLPPKVEPTPVEPPDATEPRKGPKFIIDSKPKPKPAPTRPVARPPPPGQVLSFPEGGRRKTRPARGNAVPKPATKPDPVAAVLDKVPPKRFWLYGGAVLSALLVVGVWRWWVWSLATWSSADPLGHSLGELPAATLSGDPVVEVEPDVTPFVEPIDEGDALSEVLDELKSEMSHDVADIGPRGTSTFEDALFLEMNKLVRVKTIHYEVLAWDDATGLPSTVAITVEIRSQGDASRELGAVALNMGKYIGHYDWIVRQLDVELIDETGTARQTSLDPGKATLLYDDQIGLVEALGLE
ncbi:MAG: hypothetical protein GY913_18825 [Proteobacteria bacterium]|nr:hypothetical protein [Pseudomonadota bacterium]MCP4918965.1 hypothetical protein [Pseudomonadota bacterium]